MYVYNYLFFYEQTTTFAVLILLLLLPLLTHAHITTGSLRVNLEVLCLLYLEAFSLSSYLFPSIVLNYTSMVAQFLDCSAPICSLFVYKPYVPVTVLSPGASGSRMLD